MSGGGEIIPTGDQLRSAQAANLGTPRRCADDLARVLQRRRLACACSIGTSEDIDENKSGRAVAWMFAHPKKMLSIMPRDVVQGLTPGRSHYQRQRSLRHGERSVLLENPSDGRV